MTNIRRASRRALFLRYLARLLPLLLVFALLTLFSANYINEFVRAKNVGIATSVAHQLAADVDELLRESDMVMVSYTSDLTLFKRLGSVLNAQSLSYDELQTLRALQENVDISQRIRPYIHSICCLPITKDGEQPFYVSGAGVQRLGKHPDSAYLRRALDGESPDTYVLRDYQSGNLPVVRLLSRATQVRSVSGLQKIGLMVINLDVKYIQSLLQSRAAERGNHLFLIRDAQGADVFASAALGASRSEQLQGNLTRILSGDPIVAGGEEYAPVVELSTSHGFTVRLLVTSASLYENSERLVVVNTMVLLMALLAGCAGIFIATRRRYGEIVRVGSYLDALDEAGSIRTGRKGIEGLDQMGYASGELQKFTNSLRLHLSERELKERKLELSMLRNQLNPHFLLNTLQMLNWRVMREVGGHSELNEVIENLCKILTHLLYASDALVPLTDEVSYTELYIHMQTYARDTDVRIAWHMDALPPNARVPQLILQPILENAYKHAFLAPDGRHAEKPCIAVEFENRFGDLLIRVRDNGFGMDEERLRSVRERLDVDASDDGCHIGLSNTNKRIQLLFGRRFGIDVESGLGEGTTVSIRMPLLVEEGRTG